MKPKTTFINTIAAILTGLSCFAAFPSIPSILQAQELGERRKASNDMTGVAPSLRRSDNVNSGDRDNNPIITADGQTLFFNSTRRGDRPWAAFDTVKDRFDDDIYYSRRLPSLYPGLSYERWSMPVNLGSAINTNQDDGISAISPDGQTVYFVSLKKGWQFDGGPFYSAELHGTQWNNVQGLGSGITQFFLDHNDAKRFRVYGASISSDNHDFYFATTVASQHNNHEIWVAHRTDDLEWKYPDNLGGLINADEGSFSPCIAADNKTLYFASRRSGGYGGDDIYVSFLSDGSWSRPQNLGSAINSANNESFPAITAAGDQIYLSISNESGFDDIYAAILPEEFRPDKVILLKGIVSDKLTGQPLEAKMMIEDLQSGKTIFNATSNARSGVYSVILLPDHDYGISVNSPDHVFVSDRFTVPQNVTTTQLTRNFQLQSLQTGSLFSVNNVFFDYNRASIRPESRLELIRLADLLRDKPNLRIEIRGHADSLGSPVRNMILSQQRAERVKDYVVHEGRINASRIYARGFGSLFPVATNDTEEGRRKNRRTEFIVLDM